MRLQKNAFSRRDYKRVGFTLVEALMAMVILSMVSTAVLLSSITAMDTSSDAVDQTIALGIAQQFMDEITGKRYAEFGAGALGALGPEAGEVAGLSRQLYDDIDDYQGYVCQPPCDVWGIVLSKSDGQGGMRNAALFPTNDMTTSLRVETRVVYLLETDLTKETTTPSNYRQIHVRVYRNSKLEGLKKVAHLKKIVAYYPSN